MPEAYCAQFRPRNRFPTEILHKANEELDQFAAILQREGSIVFLNSQKYHSRALNSQSEAHRLTQLQTLHNANPICHYDAVTFTLQSHTPVPYQLRTCKIYRKVGRYSGSVNLGGIASTLQILTGSEVNRKYHAGKDRATSERFPIPEKLLRTVQRYAVVMGPDIPRADQPIRVYRADGAARNDTNTSPSPPAAPAKVDPVLRNALRYTISAKEYERLHQYLIKRSPPSVRRRVPQPLRYEAIVRSPNDYNAAAVRASLRVFLTTQTALKLWDIVTTHILARGRPLKSRPPSWLLSPNFRLSASLSLILLLHRIIYRFFTRLRLNLLAENAKPFRQRNPRVSQTLTSRLAPAIGASLAGFALGVYPSDQFRITVAIYAATRAAEFAYNALEDEGWFKKKPWWWGSWMVMPLATGQLFHAFVFDRECFPKAYGDFILKNTPAYIQRRPADYPSNLPWPSTDEIIDSLAKISELTWPPFISPILFPTKPTLPAVLTTIAPITSAAHPSISSLSCALLHPHDPSCTRTFLTYTLTVFPTLAKFFTLLLTLLSLPRYRLFLAAPLPFLNALARRILRLTTFITGAVGTTWASICLFNYLLPRTLLPTKRWYLGGFLGGMWAFLERWSGRANFLYSARLSIDSAWKAGIKRQWWKGVKNGDVYVFVAALMLVNGVFEVRPGAVSGRILRKGLGSLRGEGWVDRVGAGDVAGEDDGEGEGLETGRDVERVEVRDRKRKRDAGTIDPIKSEVVETKAD